MTIISERHTVHVEEYALVYENSTAPGGFSFTCDKQGTPLWDKLPQPARENLADCQSGKLNVTFCGVKDYSYNYQEPAQIKCDCGRVVTLYGVFENDCECGRIYNGFGQVLAPRSQWEWEGD